MWSFAEVFRRGCQVALDVQPDELQVGLQPARINGVRTHRVFVADALDNGAGYASEIGRPENLKGILSDVLVDLAARFDDPQHRICTESCPDCLRSYDNRRLHGALDWRLGIDVATLAAGEPLDTHRWLSRAPILAHAFSKGYAGHFRRRSGLWTMDSLQSLGKIAPSCCHRTPPLATRRTALQRGAGGRVRHRPVGTTGHSRIHVRCVGAATVAGTGVPTSRRWRLSSRPLILSPSGGSPRRSRTTSSPAGCASHGA